MTNCIFLDLLSFGICSRASIELGRLSTLTTFWQCFHLSIEQIALLFHGDALLPSQIHNLLGILRLHNIKTLADLWNSNS